MEEGGPSSGRPGAILDDAKCQDVWSRTEREGDVLTGDKAAPYVVNFKIVDVSGDGKITQDEFKQGCKMGMVQQSPSKPADTAGGETLDQPDKN